jgi:thioredoxin-like negative regulator of GroEL
MNKAKAWASKTDLYSKMLEVYLNCQDPNGAIIYVDSLTTLEEKRKPYSPFTPLETPLDKRYAYHEIARYWACNGQMTKANAVIDKHFDTSEKRYVLAEVAETCAWKGKVSAAEQLLAKMAGMKPAAVESRLAEASGDRYEQGARCALGRAYAEAGNIAKAQVVAETLPESRSRSGVGDYVTLPGSHSRSEVLEAIARAHVRAGNVEVALAMLKDMPGEYQSSVYDAIITEQVDKGLLDAAQATIEAFVRVPDDYWSTTRVTRHYLTLAQAAAEQGDMLAYRRFLDQAIAGAPEMWNLEQYTWTRIYVIQRDFGDLTGMLAIAITNDDESVRSEALSWAVRTLSRDGDISTAKALSKKITSDGKWIAYAKVARALVRADRATEAQAFLNTLTDSRDKAEAFRNTARSLVAMDHQEVLIEWLESIDSPVVRFNVCLGAAEASDEAYEDILLDW